MSPSNKKKEGESTQSSSSSSSKDDPYPKFRASRLIQPNLSTLEISVWTSLWVLGVIYSSYHVYLASRSKNALVVIASCNHVPI